jgi:hypothetical protein
MNDQVQELFELSFELHGFGWHVEFLAGPFFLHYIFGVNELTRNRKPLLGHEKPLPPGGLSQVYSGVARSEKDAIRSVNVQPDLCGGRWSADENGT